MFGGLSECEGGVVIKVGPKLSTCTRLIRENLSTIICGYYILFVDANQDSWSTKEAQATNLSLKQLIEVGSKSL